MSIADYPHAKKESRKRFVRHMERMAKSLLVGEKQEPEEVTIEELEAKLRGIIG